jgi:hypothetical protein
LSPHPDIDVSFHTNANTQSEITAQIKIKNNGTLLTSSKEPRLDNVTKLGVRNFIIQHLNSMVPSHSTKRSSAAYKDDFSLIFRGGCLRSHDDVLAK